MSGYKFFFYDMDDTLVFTKDKWTNAIIAYLESYGIPYDSEVVYRYLGKNCRDISNDINRDFSLEKTHDLPSDDKLRVLLKMEFEREPPEEIFGATRFMQSMATRTRQFIVSGSPSAVISNVIDHHRWNSYIEDFISSESVTKGKPDPEVYTSLRLKLGARADECLIFEDSPAGIEAAQAAGIACVVINPKVPTNRSEWIISVAEDFDALTKQRDFNDLILM